MPPGLEFFNKPSGLPTHETESQLKNGFLEFLTQKYDKKLRLAHRLDKGTSGVMVGSSDDDTLKKLTSAFESHRVRKTYLFVTDRPCRFEKWSVQSRISKKSSGVFQSDLISVDALESATIQQTPTDLLQDNQWAFTSFRKLSSVGPWTLVEAQPLTGRTHQIRLHALHSEIPLLGDSTYGGTRFFRLMLHAHKIEIQIDDQHHAGESEAPDYFAHLELLSDEILCQWLNGVDVRQALFPEVFQTPSTLRLLHSETDPLRADLLGPHIWAGWWSDEVPSSKDLHRLEVFKTQVAQKFAYPVTFSLQMRANRESDRELAQKMWFDVLSEDWSVREGQAHFWMRADAGLSPGLFLDQRHNRETVGALASEKNVLNLFSYTGGFSVCAARAGARSVTTVDTSKSYIEWSKQNFTLNKIDLTTHQFWAFDSLDFLEMKSKKRESYDLIICDPPSFGRSPRGVFKLEKDYGFLLEKIARVLAPKGIVLFSCNLEKWDTEEFRELMNRVARQNRWKILDFPIGWPDFELDRKDTVLKSVLFQS